MPAPPTLKFAGHPLLAAEYERWVVQGGWRERRAFNLCALACAPLHASPCRALDALVPALPAGQRSNHRGQPPTPAFPSLHRVKAKQPMQALDTSRYRLDPPAPTKQNDHAAWRASVNNAHAQLEHQYLRILNLELLLKHGDKVRCLGFGIHASLIAQRASRECPSTRPETPPCHATSIKAPAPQNHPCLPSRSSTLAQTWRAQTQLSEAAQKQMENELATTRKRINELNQERKLSQVAAGASLLARAGVPCRWLGRRWLPAPSGRMVLLSWCGCVCPCQ